MVEQVMTAICRCIRYPSQMSRTLVVVILALSILALQGCGPDESVGTPASWSTQLSLAEQAAKKVDKDVVVLYVSARADPIDAHRTSQNLDVQFFFVRPKLTKTNKDGTWVTKM